ncbi:glycosyltransferase family 4 protein [Poriferisphaera sp. WC338]|uniref:glycosyltransferase family 4 protein n=1 Tax=Poriferisphaera sp. WC338 TaxID=3425129 RepID=UPI003D81319C
MAKNLHILHLTLNSNFDGGTRYIYDLSESLVERGHQVSIAGQKTEWQEIFDKQSWPWLDLNIGGSFKQMVHASRVITKFVKENNVDLIHTHYRKASFVAKLVQIQCKIPFVFTVHLTDLPMGKITKALTFWGNQTHCPSTQAKAWVKSVAKISNDRLHVIPHGIDPNAYKYATDTDKTIAREQLNLPKDKTVIGYVGRFGPVKNSQWLIRFAEHFSKQELPIHLVAIGEGTEREGLKKKIKARRLEDYFTLLPFGSPMPVYHASDLIILPSKREGFSLVCLEAMATGCAVLRTATAGYEDMIIEGTTGYAVPVDYQTFINKTVQVCQHRENLLQIGINASNFVKEHLTHEKQVDAMVDLYRNTI